METGQDPYYETALTLKSVATDRVVELDCGVILRAIDTLLIIAPREFRSPKEWMLRLYRAREDITKAIEHEAEAAIEIGGENERPTGETLTDVPSPDVDFVTQNPKEPAPTLDREGDW